MISFKYFQYGYALYQEWHGLLIIVSFFPNQLDNQSFNSMKKFFFFPLFLILYTSRSWYEPKSLARLKLVEKKKEIKKEEIKK